MQVSFSQGNEVGDAKLIGVAGVEGVAGLLSDIIDRLPMLPHNRGVVMVVDAGDVGSSEGIFGLDLFPKQSTPTPAA